MAQRSILEYLNVKLNTSSELEQSSDSNRKGWGAEVSTTAKDKRTLANSVEKWNDENAPNLQHENVSQHSNVGLSDSSLFNLTQSNADLDESPKKKPTATTGFRRKHSTPVKNNVPRNVQGKGSPPEKLFKNKDTSEDQDSSKDDNMKDDESLLTNIQNIVNDKSLFQLLDEESQNILNVCLLLEHPALNFVYNVYGAQDKWYGFNYMYKDIDSHTINSILYSLVEKGILMQRSLEDIKSALFDELTEMLDSDDLKQLCKDLNLKIQSNECAVKYLKEYCRQKSISAYFNGITNKHRVMNMMREKAKNYYKLSSPTKSAFNKLYLLMYLALKENYGECLINCDKLKKKTFPIDKKMTLDNASCVFSSRQEFESYIEAEFLYSAFCTEKSNDEKWIIVKKVYNLYRNIKDEDMKRYMAYPEWLHKFTPPHIYIKILDKGVQDLKRQQVSYSDSLVVGILTTLIKQKAFMQQKMGEWYKKKTLILEKYMKQKNEAAFTLIEGFKTVTSDVAKEIMQPRAIKISRQQNININEALREELQFHATKYSKSEKDLRGEFITKKPMEETRESNKPYFSVPTDDGQYLRLSTEQYCAYYYKAKLGYTNAEHCEGDIIKSIFYLLFWDIIYMKPREVPGIFLTYYQSIPLDMYYESFYHNRKILIDAKLSKILQYTEEQLLNDMHDSWTKKEDFKLPDVNRITCWENISEVAACLGPEKVAVLCKRLATNYGYTINGFPDVTAWNTETKKIKFLEAKSDSDTPLIQQLQWMHYLQNNGIDTAFFYVGANPHRNKARATTILDAYEDDDTEL